MEEAMKTSALVAGIFLLSGCVSMSEKQKEEREYRDAENRAAYFAYRQQCRGNGGIVVINGSHGRLTSDDIPNPGDYRCQKSLSFL
jgi:hypothetical protein